MISYRGHKWVVGSDPNFLEHECAQSTCDYSDKDWIAIDAELAHVEELYVASGKYAGLTLEEFAVKLGFGSLA